jgi:hypothetical protein
MTDEERAFVDAFARVNALEIPPAVPRSPEPRDETPPGPRAGHRVRPGRLLAVVAGFVLLAGLVGIALGGLRNAPVPAVPVGPPSPFVTPGIAFTPSVIVTPTPTPPPERFLTDALWVVVEIDGEPVRHGGDGSIFVEFSSAAEIGVGDSCGVVDGGTYRLNGHDLRLDLSGVRPAACGDRAADVQRAQLWKALAEVRGVNRVGSELRLANRDGTAVLVAHDDLTHGLPTPSPVATGTAQDVRVSIRNESGVDFDRVVVNFWDQPVDYGPVPAGGTSLPFAAAHAYGYAYVQVTVDGRRYVYQPTDYVGESLLPPGDHVYVLDLVGGRVDVTLR